MTPSMAIFESHQFFQSVFVYICEIENWLKKLKHCENKYLIPQKLPHFFTFMGGTLNGSLNQNVDRNDEAVSGGSDTYSHGVLSRKVHVDFCVRRRHKSF